MKSFANIGFIDLRRASEVDLKDISSIKNTGTVVVHEHQMPHLKHIKQVNIGHLLTLSENSKLASKDGDFHLTKMMLTTMSDATVFIVNGTFKLDYIGSKELFEKVEKIFVNGRAIITEDDLGMLSGKLQVNGAIIAHQRDERVIEGTFSLDDDLLFGLAPDTKLIVDKFEVLKAYDEHLFHEKVASIRVNETFVVRRQWLRSIAPKVQNYVEVQKSIVEEGYTYFDRLTLDLSNYKIHCVYKMHIGGKLTIQMPVGLLKERVSKIICKTLEIDESGADEIQEIIEKADKIKVIDPELMSNYSKLEIDAALLQSIGQLKLNNYGLATFDTAVTESLVEEKVGKILNYGVIECSRSIQSTLLKKIKANHGKIRITDEDGHDLEMEDEDDFDTISNLGTYEF